MAGSYLSEIVPDDQIKKVYEGLNGTNPSSLSTLSSLYESSLDKMNTSFTSAASGLGIGSSWDDSITAQFCGSTVSEVENILNACKNPALEVMNTAASDTASLITESKSYLDEVDSHNFYYKNYQTLLSQKPQKNGDDDTSYDSRLSSWNSKKTEYENYLKDTYNNSEIYKENCNTLMDNLKANLTDVSSISSVSKVSISHDGITKPETPQTVDETIEKENTAAKIDSGARTSVSVPVTSYSGKVTIETYTDPETGKKYKYRLFIPEGVPEDTKLPVTLYFDNGNNGIFDLMRTGKLEAPGIVIYADQSTASAGGGLRGDAFISAMKNLTDEVVKTYNGDTDRISVTGFSLGGQAAYKMTVTYPDYFSISAPLSAKVSSKGGKTGDYPELIGNEDPVEWMTKLSQTPVVAFVGNGTEGGERSQVAWRQKDLEAAMKEYGFDDNFKLVMVPEIGHRTYRTFLEPYEGYNSVLEYIQAQVKTPKTETQAQA